MHGVGTAQMGNGEQTMADIENVIKGLECCLNRNDCKNCPYKEEYDPYLDCIDMTRKDAIELLKEQEAVVRCKDCKHRPTQTKPPKTYGFSIEFPEESKCPCQCDDGFYSWYPNDDWFCANGERKEVK